MPTAPSHQGCPAAHSIAATHVVGVAGVELGSAHPVGGAGAEQVDDQAGVAAGGEPAGRLRVGGAGDEVLPVGQHGDQGRHRPVGDRAVDVGRERHRRVVPVGIRSH